MTAMSQRVHALMTKLPNDINPINLEELRRIKQDLVQLENKADQVGGGRGYLEAQGCRMASWEVGGGRGRLGAD